MLNETRQLIKKVYGKLDYSLPFAERLSVVEDISENEMLVLCKRLNYYQDKMRNDNDAYNAYMKITYCMDSVNNYLLFSKDLEHDGEYPYTVDDNFKMTNSGKFKTTHKLKQSDSTQYKNIKVTIQSYLKRDDVPEYIYDYISYMETTRHLISQVEKQVKNLGKDIDDNHIFAYVSSKGTEKAILYKDYIRLRQATGYTKNNSVVFDKEILYMLQNHYEPMKSKSSNTNVWVDTFEDLESKDEFDIDLLDVDSMSCLLKAMCYYGESPIFDNYFEQIEELVGMVRFTPLQSDIYSMLKAGRVNSKSEIEKIPLGAIAKKLNRDRKQISNNFDYMVTKLVDEYERFFEDNIYYLEIVKGKYKTCTVCGEVKIATERNFYKDNSGQFGLRAECKDCFGR